MSSKNGDLARAIIKALVTLPQMTYHRSLWPKEHEALVSFLFLRPRDTVIFLADHCNLCDLCSCL